MGVLLRPLTSLLAAQPPSFTPCWLHHVPFPNKKSFVLFSCSPWHSHLDKGWVFSLITLMACTSLFWVVCHPTGHFPQKSLSRNPKIDFPTAKPYPFSYLWPMARHTCIGWVQVGGAWALCMLHSHMSPWLVCCSYVCHCLRVCLVLLCVLLLIFNLLWCGWVWVFILCILFLL